MASREELIAAVQANLEAHEMTVTKNDAGIMVNCVLEAVQAVAMEGGSLRTAIGTFKRRDSEERTARNPRTGEPVQVPAKSVLAFKGYAPKVETPAKKAPAKKAAPAAKKTAPVKAAPAAKTAAPAKKKFAGLKRK